MNRDITNRQDIEKLIDAFYNKIVFDSELALFFGESVKDWEAHKANFVNYWSKQVLFDDAYEGSPLRRHIDIDHKYNRSFKPEHFELWYRIFESTVDELFVGEKAQLAKEAAKNMAKNIYRQMFIGRHPEPLRLEEVG